MYRGGFILCIVAVILMVVSIILPIVFPSIFENKLQEKFIIRPDSDMLKNYMETPIPLYYQIYIFNVTNPEDILQGAKPVLQEIGPYTYRMKKQRVNVKFNHTRGTVISQGRTYYYFEPDMSPGSESDNVTVLNTVYVAIANKAYGINSSFVNSFVEIWNLRFQMEPFMTRNVKEYLFGGYDEPVLKILYLVTNKESHKTGKSGMFYLKNGTLGDETEIISGELGMHNYQKLVKYNKKETLDFWSTNYCNQLNGTEGTQFARPVSFRDKLSLFSANLCRSVNIMYEKDVELGPMKLLRFILPPKLLKQGDENKCYCPIEFTCRSSMVDVTACKKGTPIVVSTAHFYGGEKSDIEAVVGLNPRKEHHETFLDIEPFTGLTLRAAKRIQVNMPFRRFAQFPILKNVTEIIFPILWVNESASVPLERVEKLHKTLTLPIIIVRYGSWALLITGLCLVIVAGVLTVLEIKKYNAKVRRRQQSIDKIFDSKNPNLVEMETRKLYYS